ncbi:Amino-acid acetyltransferase [Marinomonas gallaica]|uniref:Amino-acid acetyltransferase n=1 Tax=Marinomonas gallaica TaxID=1806667 RepID=A0A1C3JNU6_9GAMM|nr:amino-acid N-acetyltransferase [Marinomonas gallaica]SBT16834.1 Amino-acid acetyltransferase [Marinomonas gallaica]SBT20550.1 Amino-acid acetyltransferase [Marinomonas gallaica]
MRHRVSDELNYVDWFRHSSPYINAHRGKTLVILIPGEAFESPNFSNIIHDLALLDSLGIRLVLVQGARPQIDRALGNRRLSSRIEDGYRVTPQDQLIDVIQASSAVRVQLEAQLSMGLSNTPMANAGLRVCSGNYVVARPLGVVDGIDYGHSGEVRRIDRDAIFRLLEDDNMVLLPHLGFSPTGEVFNLKAEDVATQAAIQLKADKLIIFTEDEGIFDHKDELFSELLAHQADTILAQGSLSPETRNALEACLMAVRAQVPRSHIISFNENGGLLSELFTREGSGTMIDEDSYERLRLATIEDVGGMMQLLTPLEDKGILVRRSRELLENEIERFIVIERDGAIVACAALYPFEQERAGELACVAVSPEYRGSNRGERLLKGIEAEAKKQNLDTIFLLTTRTAHWFIERGFKETSLESLPAKKQALYNYQRNSKIFAKKL